MPGVLSGARVPLSLIALVGILAGACVRHEFSTVEVAPDVMSPDLRTATNLPDQFTAASGAETAGDCPQQLTDPGLHTTLVLQRSYMLPVADSAGGGYVAVGDYSVEPSGRYGEAEGEGLRVDCGRLSAMGVVRL
ncbi:MAG TPA: hypothetical protein VHG09_08815 [Longimicrobiales bacterium]|nr:hypothetical protein [Longimicrobiales bacterium]